MDQWYTAYGRFGTAILFTWRAIFLYLGIGLIILALFILLDIRTRLQKILNKKSLLIFIILTGILIGMLILSSIFAKSENSVVSFNIPILFLVIVLLYFIIKIIDKIIVKIKNRKNK